ncbi:SDR family NAD(P)-dependent oxidoreductase [Xanthobacter pseudotagetidis]|uniref:SDR family NAD(P)-dependent oxidoreductase n=1 Tax=Xanthobacter pseudotagetidis TaxID=3119911 RepID=UPI003727FFAB
MLTLKDKVAVVTGGSRGIGAAIARKLAESGAAVAVTYKTRAEEAKALVDAVAAAGGKAMAVPCDVTSEEAVRAAVKAIADAFGRIDVLVNNAGILVARPLAEVDRQAYQSQFDTHVWGTMLFCQAALPHFPEAGGQIVNLSSLRVYQPAAGSSLYSASKAAVSALTHALAVELGPRGITVNAIAPGITRTDMTAAMPDARRQAIAQATPLGRLGAPEDIAGAVALLCMPEARWITGRTLLADGGLVGV